MLVLQYVLHGNGITDGNNVLLRLDPIRGNNIDNHLVHTTIELHIERN